MYTIRYVSQRTGLSSHVIRAWEKRYQGVVPQRTQTNRRLYSEDDIRRLQLLKRVTDSGHTISGVATLASDELLELSQKDAAMFSEVSPSRRATFRGAQLGKYYQDALMSVMNLDPDGFEHVLDQAAIDLTRPTLLRDLIVPLFEEIGRLWRNGSLKIINEHMATSVARTFLLNLLRAAEIPDTAPKIVVATTVGQWHDMGALTVALTAAEYGWHPLYFGPNLPAEEIAAAVKQNSAEVVAISITHLLDQILLVDELRKLRRYVGKDVALLVGGRPVEDHMHLLKAIDAKYIASIDLLGEELELLSTATVA